MEPPKSRDRILERIRRSLGRGPLSGEALKTARDRLNDPRRNVVPKRSDLPREEQVQLFVELAEKQAMTIERIVSLEELPPALARRIGSLEKNVKIAPHPELKALEWRGNVRFGQAEVTDDVGLSVAFAGIAETGSIMFLSGAETPIALCFLPPVHFILLRTRDVAGTLEDAWARVRDRYGARSMPRTSLIVSGTSATGDVGQVIVRGASGPLQVHIFLLEEP